MSEQTAQDKLAAPFAVTHKKNGMDYLTGEQVTSRLNDVLGWDGWSFRVLEHGYNEEADEIWAMGELTVWQGSTPVVRQQFGSQKPNRYTKDNRIIDLGFDLKGAATDALKKCASLIGVGLYLHEKNGGVQQRPAAQPKPETTQKERATFWEVVEQMGFTREAVSNAAQKNFDGREPMDLTPNERKALLVALEKKAKEAKEKVSA